MFERASWKKQKVSSPSLGHPAQGSGEVREENTAWQFGLNSPRSRSRGGMGWRGLIENSACFYFIPLERYPFTTTTWALIKAGLGRLGRAVKSGPQQDLLRVFWPRGSHQKYERVPIRAGQSRSCSNRRILLSRKQHVLLHAIAVRLTS